MLFIYFSLIHIYLLTNEVEHFVRFEVILVYRSERLKK